MDHQPSLFDDLPTPWEEDDQSERLVATVVFTEGLDGRFDYEVPERLIDLVEPGRRLKVPLGRGNRPVVAYCVELERKKVGGRKLKTVLEVVDPRNLLSAEMLRLTQWIAEQYLCPQGQVLETVVPAGVRGQAGTRKTVVLSLAPKYIDKLDELKLPAKQAEVARFLSRSPQTVAAVMVGQKGRLHAGPDHGAAAQGDSRRA